MKCHFPADTVNWRVSLKLGNGLHNGTRVSALPRGSGTTGMRTASKFRQPPRELGMEGHNRVRKREEGAGKVDAFPESIYKVNG